MRSLDGKRLVAVVNADQPDPTAAPADWLLSCTGFPAVGATHAGHSRPLVSVEESGFIDMHA